MKKVLVLSGGDLNNHGDFQLHAVLRELKHSGFETQHFNYRRGFTLPIPRRFWRFLYHPQLSRRLIERMMLEKISRFKPDLLFVLKGECIRKGIIHQIRQSGAVTIQWGVDDIFGSYVPTDCITNISEYDYVFNFDRYYVKKLRDLGVNAHYQSCVADTKVFKYQPNEEKIYDVTFIGTYIPGIHDKRKHILSKLSEFDLHVFGPGWADAKDSSFKVHNVYSRGRSMAHLLNQSKITLNMHHEQSIESTNFRTFEALACGTFTIVEFNRELKNLFRLNKDLVCFRSISELKEKIRYYLDHPEKRQIIRNSGFQRVLSEYTFHHAVKNILNTIGW